MEAHLKTSYRHCGRVARSAASSFYYSFYLLPREKRRSMFALYAFLRATDDLADEPAPLEQRRAKLQQWRDNLAAAVAGEPRGLILPALVDTLQRHDLPAEHLYAVIEGCEMDLNGAQYETFAELEGYCHRVASAVGLACIHVWGFHGPAAIPPAIACGVAFQLTNILRDLKEDMQRGRVYLPGEDLVQFGIEREEFLQGVCDARWNQLIDFQIGRAANFYASARQLGPQLSEAGRRVYGAMFDTYFEVFSEIGRRRQDLLTHRVTLGRWQKVQIAARWLRPSFAQDHHAAARS